MIGDDLEGRSWEIITEKNIGKHLSLGKPMPYNSLGLPLFYSPGSRGNQQSIINISFPYAIFCTSYILHKDLCKNFKNSYDAAIMIERPFPFFYEITKAFTESKICETVIFQHVADVRYQSRLVEPGDIPFEALIKEEHYRHQAEVRAFWNVGIPDERFFRFKAPEAARCCRKILLKDMPDYLSDTPVQEKMAMMEHAIKASTSK